MSVWNAKAGVEFAAARLKKNSAAEAEPRQLQASQCGPLLRLRDGWVNRFV